MISRVAKDKESVSVLLLSIKQSSGLLLLIAKTFTTAGNLKRLLIPMVAYALTLLVILVLALKAHKEEEVVLKPTKTAFLQAGPRKSPIKDRKSTRLNSSHVRIS